MFSLRASVPLIFQLFELLITISNPKFHDKVVEGGQTGPVHKAQTIKSGIIFKNLVGLQHETTSVVFGHGHPSQES